MWNHHVNEEGTGTQMSLDVSATKTVVQLEVRFEIGLPPNLTDPARNSLGDIIVTYKDPPR